MKRFIFLPLLFIATMAFGQQMVEISIEITEVNENESRQLGIEWPINVEAGEINIPSLVESGAWDRLTPFTAALKALETSGAARVLSRPKLVTKSGTTAKFMVGGELPISEITMSSSKVEWKEYGIIMQITPTITSNNKIDLALSTELSRLDYDSPVGSFPSIAKRAASSRLVVKNGETMVLAGLIETTKGKSTSGVPFLSKIPLLGALFRTTRTVETRTNVLIFVTPKILEESR
ncbi:MAG: type II and III secretion system protein [Elusimicrobiota bacterium]|jgi:pilus assembly protein CpaC|nr:type II and III secretion system protein [Elusimicrobiota bacterium]